PKFTEIARSRCFTTATSGCAKLCTSMVEFGLCSCDCCGLQAVNKAHVMTQTPCKKRNLFIPIFGKYTIKNGIRQVLGVRAQSYHFSRSVRLYRTVWDTRAGCRCPFITGFVQSGPSSISRIASWSHPYPRELTTSKAVGLPLGRTVNWITTSPSIRCSNASAGYCRLSVRYFL